MNKKQLEILCNTAIEAGTEIMKIYNDSNLFNQTEVKSDNSPLTLADKNVNKIIEESLKTNFPEIPILSEEGKSISYSERKNWTKFWLVDPLDGTKEFINRNGEFTVNIALIENQQPIFGIIYVPVSDTLYYTFENKSYKKVGVEIEQLINVNNKTNNYIAVKSKSHSSKEEDDFFRKFDIIDSISVGSSLKFLMVAEGKADIYYRNGPTSEWDTAAGHSIVLNAGGKINGLSYNKENILNGSFEVYGF